MSIFQNNLRIAFRIFQRDKVFSLINVLGLSSGLAIAMMIFQYVHFEFSYENHNPNADRLVRVTMDYLDGESVVEQDCETYPPLGRAIAESLTSTVEGYARAYHLDAQTFTIGEDQYIESRIYAVDPEFFDYFSYHPVQGSATSAFRAPFELALTESAAMRYFGSTDVVGNSVTVQGAEFNIAAVIPDSPANTHLKFNALVSFQTLIDAFGETEDNWNGNNTFTYIMLKDAGLYDAFVAGIDEFNERMHAQDMLLNEKVLPQRMQDIHLYSDKSFEAEKNGDARQVYFLLLVAILVLVIAVVNYVNLATSKSLERAREVGIRKVVGSSLVQLRSQFFTEALLINLFSGLVALGFMTVFFDRFRNIADLSAGYTFLNKPEFWISFFGIILISTFLSGLFPAIILSSFRPVSVLKGSFGNSGRGGIMRKGLVILQFVITLVLLIQTLTATEQLRYMRNLDIGVDVEKTIVVRAPASEELQSNFGVFREQLLAFPEFRFVAASSVVPGLPSHEMSTTTGINLVNAPVRHSYNFYLFYTDDQFIPALDMSLIAGRNFQHDSRQKFDVIVNEESLRLWEINSTEEAIGKKLDFWGREATIIGVVKNFHQASAKSPHIPLIILHAPDFNAYASIKTATGNPEDQLEKVKSVYEQSFPDAPFDFFFLDQQYDEQFRADEKFQQVFGWLTAFAVLIACLGLFGLVSYSTARRQKELGVRKVLGASGWQLIRLLTGEYLKLIVAAIVIALPLTFYMVRDWLGNFAFRMTIEWWLFAIPVIVVLISALLTIIARTFRVSSLNPVLSLRDE